MLVLDPLRENEMYALETLTLMLRRTGRWLSRDPESTIGPTMLGWADELDAWRDDLLAEAPVVVVPFRPRLAPASE